MDPEIKSIMFNGNIKNMMNQIDNKDNKKNNKGKKRVETDKWTFTTNEYEYENQFNNIKIILECNYSSNDKNTKVALQQINKKIYGYKQQDIIKKHLDKDKFITMESVINKMIDCKLKCYYCTTEMLVLYDISRETKQWTVDRINNDLGHNVDNFYLACLECNLKRRRRSDDKYLFTKQMKLVKVPGENENIDNDYINIDIDTNIS